MADSPAGERPSIRPSLRALRSESVAALLDRPLEDEGRVLDALLSGLSAGEPMREWFGRLHDAALAQGRVEKLGAAYERIAKEGRTRLLPKAKQAELLLAASRFFGDVASDIDTAISFAERAALLSPDDEQIFDQLETLLASAQEGGRLAKLYSDAAKRAKEPKDELRLLRAAVELFEAYSGSDEDIVRSHRRIVELDPEDRSSFETLERLFTSTRRFRELAELHEHAVARRSNDPGTDETRLRLIVLYRGELRDPGKAVGHVETLLSREPIDPAALQAAEALVDHRPSAARVAPLLSEAYRRLGRLEDEASTLSLELKLARPPRLAEVHRRLALLRQDVLGDPSGALELLEPLVARDPSDQDLRRRYIEVSTTFHREVEAAKLLARAVANAKELEVRAAVAVDIAGLYAKQGDVRRSRAALEPFADEQALGAAQRLALVTRLVELHQDGSDPKALARALEVVIRLESDLSGRIAAAKRLAELCQGSVDDPALAIAAWRALLASPRADEALDRLEGLYTATADDAGLIDVLLSRAARTEDRDKARALAFRAAELRAARAPDRARAIEAYRDVLGGFGPSREALAKLAALLEQQRDYRELASTLLLLSEHALPAERAATLSRLARVRLEELRDPKGALEALKKALSASATEPGARRLAEKMLSEGDHRLDALALLEPLYRAEGSHAGIVRVLEARAAIDPDPAKRLADLDEAYAIAERHVAEPRRLLEIAGRGLSEAAHGRRAEVPWWLERFRAAAARAGDPARRAELLATVIQGVAVDRGVAAELVREAAEAQVAAGDVARAIETYRLLLSFEPSSPELLGRLDELLAQQGSPEERLSLYRAALARAGDAGRRRELLHTIALIQRRDLDDKRGASETLAALAELSPEDLAVHEALVEVLSGLGEVDRLVAELRRAAALSAGERRASLGLRLARAESLRGAQRAALDEYRLLLSADELPPEAFAEAENVAAALGDQATLVAIIGRYAERATDEREQLRALERLGDVQLARDEAAAADAFRRAARASRDIDGERAATVRSYERVLAIHAEDREAARFLFEAYAASGDFAAARRVFSILLRSDAAHEAVDCLAALEESALSRGAVRELVAMSEDALENPSSDLSRRRRELMGLRARALASSSATKSTAAAAFRALVEAFGETQDADAFRRFLEREDATVAAPEEHRWLFEWRVAHAVDKAPVLVEWARAEEQLLGDPARASKAYEAALEVDPAHAEALDALVRLEAPTGGAERLLGVLEGLHVRLSKDETTDVELKMASLLVEHLDRAGEARPLLSAVLARAPDHPEAVRIVRAGLKAQGTRGDFAVLLEGAASATEGPSGQLLIASLLEETRGFVELSESRARWHERLLELLSSEPERALASAVAAAEEMPDREALWDAAERFARKVNNPRSVADAYARVLDAPLGEELGEAIGRRIVEFHEEWFDEPQAVERLLERVLSISPRARWALDRIKLSYNAEARWDDLFALYDRAIEGASDDRERDDLLDEAALAAKDLANDQPRAIGYLERLYARKPEPRIESMLERLYDRAGRAKELIQLLERRAPGLAGRELARVERRLAGLWLHLGEAKTAFDLIERSLAVEPDETEAYELLERLVKVPAGAPPSVRKGKKKPRDVRHDALKTLEKRFRDTTDMAGLARTLEAAIVLAATSADKVKRHEELVALYLDEQGDPERALGHLLSLVSLAPADAEHRRRLDALAGRLHAEERQALHLVEVAEAAETTIALALLCEAGAVFEAIGNLGQARATYFRALAVCRDDDRASLRIARLVEPVLEKLGLPGDRCDILERIVAMEPDRALRRSALGAVGRIAFEELGDTERAARAYRARVDEDPADLEAWNGLQTVFETAQLHLPLVQVLGARSGLLEGAAARADRVRIARLYAEKIGDPGAAIEAWRSIRADFGSDEESFAALSALLETEKHWDELSALVEQVAEGAALEARRISLFRLLGDLHRDRTAKPVAAIEAYVRAGDFERTISVGDVLADRQLAVTVASRLLELAVAAWPAAPPEREPAVARAAAFAIETLVRRHLEAGEAERVVETELRGASLPFERAQRRRLKRDAAWTSCDRLERPAQAIRILEELFAEDPADEVASASVTRFARLLAEAGRKADLALLWEQQARCRADASDRPSAAALWTRAAGIWETELGNVDRAIAAYRQGAAIGGEASLEALARIYSDQKSWRAAATALEWLAAQSSREDLAERVLRLADSYLSLGEWERAQARLEHAAATAIDASAVRKRLADLYRRHAEWGKLADLLVAEAERASDDRTRRELLREAAGLHSVERGDPAAAVPLLERAVDIDPEEPALRLSLSDALRASGRYDDAAAVLRAQIERYGHRRPKDRAIVHLYLARVSLTRGSRAEALAELELGAKINPAHPGILYELGRVAFEEGKLARAESTYRALLLVLRKPEGDPGEAPARAEIYLDLSDIAALSGSPERAAELVESAFEAALDSPNEAAALERALRKAGRLDLLSRAIESRVRAAPGPAAAARALSDLVLLHAERVPDGRASGASSRIEKEATHIHRDMEAGQLHDPGAWAALTLVYEWLGDEGGEASALEHRVEGLLRSDGPLDVEPVLRLARLRLSDKERRDEGVVLVERALDAGADSSRAWELLYDASAAGAGHRGLLRLLARIAREPGRERAFVEVAVLEARAGSLRAEGLREAVSLARELGDEPARVALLSGAVENCAADYANADRGWLFTELARVEISAGRFAAATDLFERASDITPGKLGRSLAIEAAGLAAGELSDLERAARLYSRALEGDAADRSAWEPLLEVYRRKGDRPRLIALIESTAPLVESSKDRSRLRFEEATLMLEDPGRTDDAVRLLERIVEEDATMAAAAELLATLLERQGRLGQLIALVANQLDVARSSADEEAVESLSLKLGALLERGGERERALEVYTAVLDWRPACREALRAVVRLEDMPGHEAELADAIEQLVPVEESELAASLAVRLVALRVRDGDADRIERALEMACAANPLDGSTREQLVARCLERGDSARVADVLFRAFKADTRDLPLLLRAAEAFEKAGQPERAVEALAAYGDDTDQPDLHIERARLFVMLGAHGAALDAFRAAQSAGVRAKELIAALDAAIEASGGDASADYTLSLVAVLESVGETTTARECLGRLLKEHPRHRDALRRLASICAAEARWDETAATYRRLIPLEEGDDLVGAAMNLADACEQSGRLADARGGLERALVALPESAELRARLRQIYERTGATRELADLLVREARSQSDKAARAGLLTRAAELLLERNEHSKAIAVLEDVRQESPENILGAVLFARALSATGTPQDAMNALQEVVTLHRGRRYRDLSLVHREISNIHLEAGDLSQALDALSKAFELDMRNGELAMQLGHLALDVDDKDTAAKALRAVTMMKLRQPGATEGTSAESKAVAYYHLGRIAQAEGDVRKARLMASKAVVENPSHAEAQELLKELKAG